VSSTSALNARILVQKGPHKSSSCRETYNSLESGRVPVCLNRFRAELTALSSFEFESAVLIENCCKGFQHTVTYPFSEQQSRTDSVDPDIWALGFGKTFHQVHT
jgi:hypothetical protein